MDDLIDGTINGWPVSIRIKPGMGRRQGHGWTLLPLWPVGDTPDEIWDVCDRITEACGSRRAARRCKARRWGSSRTDTRAAPGPRRGGFFARHLSRPIERTNPPVNTASMHASPNRPKPIIQSVYKIASKAVWLGAVETPDEATWRRPRRKFKVRKFKVPAKKPMGDAALIRCEGDAGARPNVSIN